MRERSMSRAVTHWLCPSCGTTMRAERYSDESDYDVDLHREAESYRD